MAEDDEESLIGYDPLAWLNEADNASDDNAPLPVDLGEADEALPVEAVEAIDDNVSVGSDEQAEQCSTMPKEVIETVPERSGKIVLDASQTIRNVAVLHERLLNALNQSEKIDIDASEVETIDTATLQLLLVLKQTAIKMQKQVAIDFPSEKFIEAADLLGLSEMLDVDQAFAGFF